MRSQRSTRKASDCSCGASYERFRSGFTYDDAVKMLWWSGDETEHWHRKDTSAVLRLMSRLKRDAWESVHGHCDTVASDSIAVDTSADDLPAWVTDHEPAHPAAPDERADDLPAWVTDHERPIERPRVQPMRTCASMLSHALRSLVAHVRHASGHSPGCRAATRPQRKPRIPARTCERAPDTPLAHAHARERSATAVAIARSRCDELSRYDRRIVAVCYGRIRSTAHARSPRDGPIERFASARSAVHYSTAVRSERCTVVRGSVGVVPGVSACSFVARKSPFSIN